MTGLAESGRHEDRMAACFRFTPANPRRGPEVPQWFPAVLGTFACQVSPTRVPLEGVHSFVRLTVPCRRAPSEFPVPIRLQLPEGLAPLVSL